MFLLSQNIQIISGGQEVLYTVGNGNSSLGNKKAGHEAGYSPSSCTEIKNAWNCISIPHIRPGVYSRNSSCIADITVHGTVFISAQNRFMEKSFYGRTNFRDIMYWGDFY